MPILEYVFFVGLVFSTLSCFLMHAARRQKADDNVFAWVYVYMCLLVKCSMNQLIEFIEALSK